MGRSLAATVLTTLTDLQSLSPQVYRIIYPKQRKQKLASLLELGRNRSQRVTLSDISRGTTTTQNNMIGVMTLHPAQRNMMMERFPCWPGDDSDMMESVMDMMEGWNNAPRMMRPRGWSTPRVRCCPYGATPAWRSRGNCLPLLLNDLTSVLAPASVTRRHGNTHSGDNKSQKESTRSGDNKSQEESTHSGDNKSQEESTRSGDNKSQEESTRSGAKCGCSKDTGGREDTTVSKDCNKDKSNVAKGWQYSVDVGGCEEVRAFTERGMLTVEGRGRRGESTIMVRHVTTLPTYINTDTLTSTLKKDGHLVVSYTCGADTPAVTNIPITTPAQQQSSDTPAVTNIPITTPAQQQPSEDPPLAQEENQHAPETTQNDQDLASEKTDTVTNNSV